MRTEPTAPNRQNVRDAWLQTLSDHAPDAVGPCGDPSDGRTATRRASRPGGTSRWGSDSHRAKRRINLLHIRPYVVSRRASISEVSDGRIRSEKEGNAAAPGVAA